MEYRRLGRSGIRVSTLALGTMNFGSATNREEAFRIVDAALEAGINLFDCADIYAGGGSEHILGEALARDGKRATALVTSKVFMPTGPGPNDRGNSRHHILESCERSLRSLRTDHLDLYFLHRTDFDVSQEESLSALDLLVRQGKVRSVGVSTHPAWRTVEALLLADRHGWPKPVCEQPPYNLLDRRIENEILPMCRYFDLGVLTWSPLAQGMLAGRYEQADRFPEGSRATQRAVYAERITDAGIQAAARLAERAHACELSPAQFAVAWVLHQPGVSAVLLGPRSMDQLRDLLPAAEARLSREDLRFCDTVVNPGGWVSNHFNTARWPSPDTGNSPTSSTS
jgi:aryl-alcohol dehydrogenase-like predicted oxidoreductase